MAQVQMSVIVGRSVATAAAILMAAACGGETTGDKGDAATSDSTADVVADAGHDVVVFNGCTAADYVDRSEPTATRIVSVGATYSPRCLTIKVGQQVVFKGDVNNHGMATDAGSGPFAAYPIVGDEAHVSFPEAGYFPYYDETNKASTGVVRALP